MSRIAVIVEAADGAVRSWGPDNFEVLGRTAQETIGEPFAVATGQRQAATEGDVRGRVLGGAHVPERPVLWRHKSGQPVTVCSSMAPLLGREGAVVGIVHTARVLPQDGHEVKCPPEISQSEQQRSVAQMVFRMAESVRVGLALREFDGTVIYVNAAYRRIFDLGVTDEASEIGQIGAHLHPDDIEALRSLVSRVTVSMAPVHQELRILRPDGDVRWIRVELDPVFGETKDIVRLASRVEDITADKRAEIALRESEDRFRRTANALEVGVSLRQLDPPRFLYVNDKYIELVGFDPTVTADAPVRAALDGIHVDDRQAVLEGYWNKAAAGDHAEAEMRISAPGGSTRWLRVTSHPVVGDSASVGLAVGTIEDITARKKAESTMAAAVAATEAASATRSEFFFRMGDELRTPLNAVLGFAQLLERDDLSESQREAVDQILGGGHQLLTMIDDLLDPPS